jgi:hypothetical protein
MIVVHQIRIPLVGLRAKEPVEPLEASADRPLVLDRREVHLILGAQVPLADHVGVPAALAEHLGDRRALERDMPVRVGKAGSRLRDARHPVRSVISSGQQARARRRAQRSRMKVCVPRAALGDAIDVRCLDQPPVGLHRRESDIVQHDVHHARRALRRLRLRVRGPVGYRLFDINVHDPAKWCAHPFLSVSKQRRLAPSVATRTTSQPPRRVHHPNRMTRG